jgi:hypothetical protein
VIGIILLGAVAVLGLAATARDLRDDGRATWAQRRRIRERE